MSGKSINSITRIIIQTDFDDYVVANSEDEKMSRELQMNGIVPWKGFYLDKGKKRPFNFKDFRIECDGCITGHGCDEKGHFKVEGELTWYTNKTTKEKFPRAIFEKKYGKGTTVSVCKGFIENGTIKGDYNYGSYIQFGDFEMTT